MGADPLIPLDEWLDAQGWPLGGLLPEALGDLYITPPAVGPAGVSFEVLVGRELALHPPGIEDIALVVAAGTPGAASMRVELSFAPFALRLVDVDLALRVPASVLRPVDRPDATHLEITLGTVDVGIDGDGNLELDLSAVAGIPRCEVAGSGVLVQIGALTWVTPATAAPPPGTPAGFSGLYLDDVTVEVPGLPAAVAAWRMDDVFIGATGFSGTLAPAGIVLGWDGADFTGTATGELFGFKAGLSAVAIGFQQSALTAFEVRGDVFLPYVERRIGLALGIAADGSLTATAGLPATADPGVGAGSGTHLVELDLAGVLRLALDQVSFALPAGGPAVVELTGEVELTLPAGTIDLDVPPIGLRALRIDSDGNVAVEGGWLELPDALAVSLSGFTLEITRLGFGRDGDRPWIGLNGGVKLAEGLPMGVSVEGLKVTIDPAGGPPAVALEGIGLELEVPGAFAFAGSIAFFADDQASGFRGHGGLSLPSLKLGVEADVVIGRTAAGETFFYFHLAVDLPVGIPLMQTGAAIYGFQGLVANNMAPDRRPDEPWYHGWYVREPRGATSGEKWAVRPGAFALGVGATLGTAVDDGFTASVKALLVLVLPGPVILLEGKGSFLANRPSASDPGSEGTFEALVALDVPAKLFQVNLGITYDVPDLIALRGGAEVAMSWAVPRPARMWHVYLGEDTPPERRWQARILSILDAYAYFMVEAPSPGRAPVRAGAWAGIDERWEFGPVTVALTASAEVRGELSAEPVQMSGRLAMLGRVEVAAFGARVMIRASAEAEARGPTPWWVALAVEAAIEIDLWLFRFEWSHRIELEWGDPTSPPPRPVQPLVARIAVEHALSSESFDAYTDTRDAAPVSRMPVVPPDGRPVVVFNRPVRDLGQVGSPSVPGSPAAEAVGPAAFSYRLGHVVLVRTDGGDRVVAAAGVAHVGAAGVVTLPGAPGLPGAAGGRMSLGGASPVAVTAVAGGTVSLAAAPAGPEGRRPYRLGGPRPAADVSITAAARATAGLVDLTLAVAPGGADDVFAGGDLTAGGVRYPVAGNSGTTVTVRAAGTLPATGDARLEAPEPARLEGAWLLADPADPAPTKLMLHARTPYAAHRRSERSVMEDIAALAPDYVCGPTPQAEPICVRFDDVPPGPLGKETPVERLIVQATGEVLCAPGPGTHRHLAVGRTPTGLMAAGEVLVGLDGPAERVIVHCDADEAAEIEILAGGLVVDGAHVRPGMRDRFEFHGHIEAVRMRGHGARLYEVCFWPGWTCTGFEAASFPQRSSGEVSYAGLVLQSAGAMEVTAAGVLVVAAPPRRPRPWEIDIDRLRRPLPRIDPELLERLGVLPLPEVLPPLPPSPPEIDAPWLTEPAVAFLPGVGEVRLRPRASVPRSPVPPSPAERLVEGAPVHRLRSLGAGGPVVGRVVRAELLRPTSPPSLAVLLPAPATRVRVRLDGPAVVTAIAGTAQVAQAQGGAGDDIILVAADGWIDRVLLTGTDRTLRLVRVCVDAGDLGWRRYERWLWRQSVQRSVEALYADEPVLAPGDYLLEVHVAWADERAGGAETWSAAAARFTVGPPPGLAAQGAGDPGRYPREGALAELATYVAATLPTAGGRPHYRAHDVGVSFRATHVDRMYLEAGAGLRVAVVDPNGAEVRPGSPNAWGRGPWPELGRDEYMWVRTLNNDGTDDCATVDLARVALPQTVTAGAGELLQPAALHTAQLRAGDRTVFAFEFTTSRYADLRHHLAAAVQRARPLGIAPVAGGPPAAVPAARAARAAVTAAAQAARTAAQAAGAGTATASQLDARATTLAALRDARAALIGADEAAFRALMASHGLAGERPLPERVEVAVLSDAFLLESPEPLHWDRVVLSARRHASPPLRFTRIAFAGDPRLAPDTGSFRHAGRRFSTAGELRVVDGALASRVGTEPLDLTMAAAGAGGVTAVVRARAGVTVNLEATGAGGPVPRVTRTAVADGELTLTLTGDALTAVRVVGAGAALVSFTVGEPFVAGEPAGPVRIAGVRLPASAADTAHHVELTAYGHADLAGLELRWRPARTGAPARLYHRFAAGDRLADAAVARVQGGVVPVPVVPGVPLFTGGTVGQPPVEGMVVELVDAAGTVLHEFAAVAAAGAVSPLEVVPNGDRTRAVVLPPAGQALSGFWELRFSLAREGDPDLPRWSVGGVAGTEEGGLGFVV